MSHLSDFVSDNNPTAVFHVDKKLGIPDYVKSASVITPEDVADLAPVAFAAPGVSKFPIFSKAATWFSAAYFYGNKMEDKDIEDRIKNASVVFGCADDVSQVKSLFSDLEKKASAPAVKYALTADFNGQFGRGVQNFYPISNYGEILGSSEMILKDASEGALPLEYFRTASVNLIKAANEHGVPVDELHDKLIAAGTLCTPDWEMAERGIEHRKQAGLSEDKLQEYRDVVLGARAEFEKSGSVITEESIENNDRWVDIWCDLDRDYGIKYAGIPTPYQSFYAGLSLAEFEKAASEHVFIGDVMVPREELMMLQPHTIDEHFTKEDASVIKSAREYIAHVSGVTSESTGRCSDELSKLDADTSHDLLKVLLKN